MAFSVARRTVTGAAVLGALLLAGCSVSVTPDGADPGAAESRSVTESTPSDAQPTTPDGEASTPAADQGVPATPRGEESPTRAAMRTDVEQQLTCGNGTLTISEFASVVEVTDDCAELIVSGNSSVVVAQSVGTLTLSAWSGEVSVVAVDKVILDANSVKVYWEEGTPTVTGRSHAGVLMNAWDVTP